MMWFWAGAEPETRRKNDVNKKNFINNRYRGRKDEKKKFRAPILGVKHILALKVPVEGVEGGANHSTVKQSSVGVLLELS